MCVSSLREQEEVDWLRENFSNVLVLLVDADNYVRTNRYVEQHVDTADTDRETVKSLREELYKREQREKPYPDHELTIRNDLSTRDTLSAQIQRVVGFFS